MTADDAFREHAKVVQEAAERLPATLAQIATELHQCFERGNKLLACGNGGSASDAEHLVAELVGRYRDERRALPAMALAGGMATITAVAIVNSIKVRTAELLVERGAMPPVITRASVVGAERSRSLFERAYEEHARRIARAIIRATDDGAARPSQEVKPS